MVKKDLVYKSVLIVGNGFDINLGLRTSYSDYFKSDFFKSQTKFGCKVKNFTFYYRKVST